MAEDTGSETKERVVITISRFQAGIVAAFIAFLLTGAVAGGLGTWYAMGRLEVVVKNNEAEIKNRVTLQEFRINGSNQQLQYAEIKRSLERIEDRLNMSR